MGTTACSAPSLPPSAREGITRRPGFAVRRVTMLLVAAALAACAPEQHGTGGETLLLPGEVLGGLAAEGFARALEPRPFRFPEDHGPHPDFRNEWWYLTGNLEAPSGRRFGYQLTFFRVTLRLWEEYRALAPDSAWAGNEVWLAHAALSDLEGGRHLPLERFSRANPDLAGAQAAPFRVWLENWELAAAGEGADFPWRLSVEDPAFSLRLELEAAKPAVPQGEEGLSRKSAEPGNASYYYSFTRLLSEGELQLDGERFAVAGESWLDREWSTSALAPDQSGWDWFSLQLADGTELMYYQLRLRQGGAHPYSAGNFTDLDGVQHPIAPADIRLSELETWTSPYGVSYTTAWRLDWQGRSWLLRAVLDAQLMDLSLRYWEGAVDVLDAATQAPLGRGYLEMVRE